MNFRIYTFFLLLLQVTSSYANPFDIYGVSGYSRGRNDAGGVSSRNGESLYLNPGSLALGKGTVFEAGTVFQYSFLNTPYGDQSIRDPFYVNFSLAFNMPFRGFLKDRIRVGITGMTPINEIAWVRTRLPREIFYPYYENRTQRLIIVPGVSFLIFDTKSLGKLGIGFGINYFSGLEGAIIGYEGATRSVEARVFEELEGSYAVTAGISWEREKLRLGFTYRQAFGVDFHNVSFNHVAGTDINIDLTAQALYSPHTVVWSAGWFERTWNLELNIIEQLWSYYKTPFVSMRSQLPLVGSLTGELPESEFNNTLGVKIGGSYNYGNLTFSGGVGFEQSFITQQTGVTNIMDGHKYSLSMGLSWEFTKGMKVHAHLRYQGLISETHTKKIVTTDGSCGEIPVGDSNVLIDEIPCVVDDPSTYGFQTSNGGYPSVTSGGGIISGGLSLEVTK
ncbi:MAG: outer membrane protein transport protein [Deltaproteobacteria bacterium]|nr:outer membrane protein transport protein [Deltaproteobacteria bacterium]